MDLHPSVKKELKDNPYASAFDFNPDKGRIVHDEKRASESGKGDAPRHNLKNYGTNFEGIDWNR